MFQVLFDMIETYMNFEIKLGIRESRESEVMVLLKERFDGMMQGPAFAGDGGARIVAAAGTFLELAEKSAITLEEAMDGSYKAADRRHSNP
jgi:hypothetical protein